MADVSPNSFENMTHSGLFRVNSKDDKNVSLSLDVYMGNASLVVFTGAGGKPWKMTLPAKLRSNIAVMLKKMKADPRPCREPVFIREFVEENGKKGFQQKGCIGFGIDENLIPYIDIAANDLNGKHMFPIKADPKFDFSNTTMSEKDMLIANLDYLIDMFTLITPLAERLSSFKRTGGQGGGGGNRGNFSGGGGNRGNYGGGGGGGGNYNNNGGGRQQQSNTFSGPDVENDLHV